jgi:hypothetical protein
VQRKLVLSTPLAERRTSGSTSGWSRYSRNLRHAEFGDVDVRAAGLPERSALAHCQRADRQAGL